MKHLLRFWHQFLYVVMHKDKRLKLYVKVFVWRKNEVVGELDDAVEVLAAAFGVELKDIRVCEMRFVLVLMSHAMKA